MGVAAGSVAVASAVSRVMTDERVLKALEALMFLAALVASWEAVAVVAVCVAVASVASRVITDEHVL